MLVRAVELADAAEPEPVLAAVLVELLQAAAVVTARQPTATARIAFGLRPLVRRATLRRPVISNSPFGIFELVNDQILHDCCRGSDSLIAGAGTPIHGSAVPLL